MKRLLTRTGVLVGLTLMLGIAGHAQVSQQYRAEIPFDFQVNNKSYTAGNYSVGPVSASSNVGSLAILDRKRGKMQLLGQTHLGEAADTETARMIFVKANGRFILSRITTPTFALKMKAPKTDIRLGKYGTLNEETVAVDLKR